MNSTNIQELENERYQLIEKIKDLEMKKSNIESESQRKDDKVNEMVSKVSQYQSKLQEYRERAKLENKSVCELFRKFASILREVELSHQNTIDYITKILHGLAIAKDHDLTDFSFFDCRQALEDLLSSKTTQTFKKIDVSRLKKGLVSGLGGFDGHETFRLFDQTYKTLQSRLENCGVSAQEIAHLSSRFDAHQQAVNEQTSAMLRNGSFRPSVNLDESICQRSKLDESCVFADGLATDRSTRKLAPQHSRVFSLRDESVLEEGPGDFLESPKMKTSLSRGLAQEESALSLKLQTANLYHGKLEEKSAEMKKLVEAKKKALADLEESSTGLEIDLEACFEELEDLETQCLTLENYITMAKRNKSQLQSQASANRTRLTGLISEMTSQQCSSMNNKIASLSEKTSTNMRPVC